MNSSKTFYLRILSSAALTLVLCCGMSGAAHAQAGTAAAALNGTVHDPSRCRGSASDSHSDEC